MDKPLILVVEDDVTSRRLAHIILHEAGYQVVDGPETASQAVKTALEIKPDLVLMDINLAGRRDGIEAASELWSLQQQPVVFLTAYSQEEFLERAKEAEPYGYLVKPIQRLALLSTIEMALYKSRMEKERRQLTQQLQEALDQVRTLEGLLPICAGCKSIRNDKGYWQKVEVYLSEHSQAKFTHGICPQCQKELYPEDEED
jgi:AmiR/NasT family two-component response regulator